MNLIKQNIGELIGTFILVFIGCSSVAISVLGIGLHTLLQVALIWGLGVAIAIYSVRRFCLAHLNPAVSLSFYLEKKIRVSQLVLFTLSQFIGALIAGILVYLIFNPFLIEFEELNGIIRGESSSRLSAKMFGEYFPNPGSSITEVSHTIAMFSEGLGTSILVFVILMIGKTKRKIGTIGPVLIGLTVTVIILFFAPFTQGGFNPARDFGPRLVAFFGGWKTASFPEIDYSFFTVYILSPFLGAILATIIHSNLRKT